MSWSIVSALYDSYWEVYKHTMQSVQQVVNRSKLIQESWLKNAESQSDQVLEIMNAIQSKFPVLKNFPENLRPIEKKSGPQDFKSGEKFIKQVANLYRSIVGKLAILNKQLELRDIQLEEAKRQILNFSMEKLERERELVAWSNLLKSLLKSNTELRKQIHKHKPGISDFIRFQRAIVVLQKRFRKRKKLMNGCMKTTTAVKQNNEIIASSSHSSSPRSTISGISEVKPIEEEEEEEYSQLDLYLKQKQLYVK